MVRRADAVRNEFEEIRQRQRLAEHFGGMASDLDAAAMAIDFGEAAGGPGESPSSWRNILPPSVAGGRLGQQAQITYNPTPAQLALGIVQEATVMQWQGDKTQSQAFTVDVDLVGLPYSQSVAAAVSSTPSTGGVSLRPYAKVVFGADGLQSQPVKVDLGFGLRLTGAGNLCIVNVGMDAPAPGAPSAVMSVGARMGFYAAPSQMPVTLTQYIDNLAVGAYQFFQRPFRATQAQMLYGFSAAPINVAVNFYDSTLSAPIYSFSFSNASATPLQTVVLTNDVYWIQIVNNGQAAVSLRFPFLLSL